MNIEFSQEELGIILQALDKVPVSGIGVMQEVLALAQKVHSAAQAKPNVADKQEVASAEEKE
jgi:hypothetical protein